MPAPELTGQVITSVNYFKKPFYFTPENVHRAARHFAAAGITKIEVPEGVLDPDNKTGGRGIDATAFEESVKGMPQGTEVIATYIGAQFLGQDNKEYAQQCKRKISILFDAFPKMKYVQLHPFAAKQHGSVQGISDVVHIWNDLATFVSGLRKGAQLCFHNHYDTSAETSSQVMKYLNEIEMYSNPALRWGLDTGHLHGVNNAYMEMLRDYAHLIGNYFHIKAKNPAFDKNGSEGIYDASRDWTNGKTYRGFVCPADPGVITPFKEIFKIIMESKGRIGDPSPVYGALEIDCPRQHPLYEIAEGVAFLTLEHRLKTQRNLSPEQLHENIEAMLALEGPESDR